MRHAGGTSGARFDFEHVGAGDNAVVVPDAHLLFSGEYHRSGRDLVISDASQRFVVRDYFQHKDPPPLVSPDGALLDARVIAALTGHTEIAQAGGAIAGKVIGQIVKMTGSASVVRNGVTVVLNVGDAVYQNDVLQTGSGSTLGLVLEDGTAFNLSANARLMLNELVYDPGSTSNSSLVTLVQGAAQFVAGQVAKTGDMKVATPSANIGIRGTAVRLEVTSNDGPILVSVIDQGDGQVHAVEVRDRQGTLIATVTSNGPSLTLTPTANFQLVAQETAKSPAQVAQESQAFQGLQQTYDAGKQINPNLPQHTQNDKAGDNNANATDKTAANKADNATDKAGGDANSSSPKATTATGSTPAGSTSTEFKAPVGTSVVNVASDTTVTVVVSTTSTAGAGAAASTAPPTSVVDNTPTVVTAVSVPAPAAPVIGTVRKDVSTPVTDNGFSNNATLMVSGTADADSTVTVYDTDGTTVVGSGVATGGSYAITTAALSEGSHTLSAKATDAAGNQGATSTAFHVTIDTAAPNSPVMGAVTDDASPRTGTVVQSGSSNDTTPTITGAAEAGATVTIYDTDGTTVLGTGVATGGAFSITTSPLGEGSHTLTAKATDAAGNEGAASTTYQLAIDLTAPNAPSILSVTDDFTPSTGPLVNGDSTNDPDLTVRVGLGGTNAVAGDSIQLYDGASTGTPVGASYTLTAADIANGFADLQTGALSYGATYTITARIADQAGNESSQSGGFVVTTAPSAPVIGTVTDDVLPVVGTVADNAFSNDTTLTLAGTAEAGSTVTIYDTDGTTVLGTGVATGGNYSITTSALGQGSHTLTAKATDAVGNEGPASAAFHVTIDTSAPSAPVISVVADDASPVTGAVADNGFSNDTALTLAGTAETGSTVTIYDTDGTTVLGTGVATGGNYSITTSALGQGSHTLTAKAADAAGNQGVASTAFHVIIDTSAPSAPVISTVTDDVSPVTGTIADSGFSNDTTLTLTGTAEAGSTVTIYDTDGTTILGTGVATGGSYSITTSALNSGSHTLTAKATDAAGNQGTVSTAFHVTIDTSAPSVPAISAVTDNAAPVTGAIADNGFSNDTTLTLTGTAEAGATVTIYDTDGTTVLGTGVATGGNYSITSSALGSGSHTLTAKATDVAGNQGAASTAFHVTIDASAPSAPAISTVTDDVSPVTGAIADNGFSNDTTLTLTGTAEVGSTVTIFDTDGTTVLGTGVATGGNYSITTSALGQGSHTLTAKATDAAGNQGAASTAFHVTIDASAPPAPVITTITDDVSPVTGAVADNGFSNDTTLTLAGTAEAGSTITIYDTDGTTILGTGVAVGGNYSITTSALSSGSHTLTAKATDAAGNQGAASTAFHVTIDASAPSAPTISAVTDDASPVTGAVADNGFSNDATLTLTGTAEAGSTVTIYDTDGTTVLGSGVATGGNYSITTSALSSGSHTLTSKATDAAGNQGAASTAFHVTIDTSAPSAPVVSAVTDDVAPVTGPLTSGGSTNDTDLTVRVSLGGTGAAAGDTLQLYNGASTGSQLGTSYTLTSGDIANGFADVQTGTLSNGMTYTVTARLTDKAGNQSSASNSFVITETGTAPLAPSITLVTDDVAPSTGPLSNGGSSNDTDLMVKVSLVGTNAVAGDSIQLYNGTGTGSQLGTSYTLTSGDIANGFANVQTGALSNGVTYTITARVTDQAGNQSSASGSFIVTEDTTAPSAPVISTVTDDVSPVIGPVADNGFSNDTTLTLTGTAETGSTVTIYDTDGTTVLGTGIATGGSYSIATSALSLGNHTLTAKAIDAAGNQGLASTAFHVTIDTSAPSAPAIGAVTDDVSPIVGTVTDNGFSNDTTLTLTGTAEAGSTVMIYDTDGTTVLGTGVATGGNYSITTSALSAGSHTLSAKATDSAANQSAASAAFHVTIDASAPSAPAISAVTDDVSPVTGAVADNGFSNDTTLTLTGTAEAGSTVTIYDTDGTTVLATGVATGGNYSITTSALGQGSHTLTAKSTNAAGNQGVASTAFHVTIDTSAPSSPVISAVTDDVSPVTGPVVDNGFSNDTTLTLTGTAEAGSTVTIYDTNGTTVLGTGVATGGSYSITTSVLGTGSHTLTAKATDAAGNQGAASTAFHVTIDTSAPATPTISTVADDAAPVTGAVADNGFSNDTTLTLTGTAEAGSTVTIYDTNGTTILGTGVATGGNYSITTSALGQGSHTLTAKATDAAGNQGAASTAFHVTVNLAVPTDIILSNSSVAENSVAGTVVGALSDIDSDANDTASYILLDDVGGRFAISGGNLVVAGALDYETATSHQVTVQVTDSVGFIFSKVLTVNVSDVAGVTLSGDTGPNTLIGTPEADTLNGLDGNDRLQGLGGNDTLNGGSGFDRAVYTDAAGAITANLLSGTVVGAGVGTDTLIAVEGVVGSNYADHFDATGFTGDSQIPGTPFGFSEFEGGGGDDIIVGGINSQGHTLTRVSYLGASAGVTVDIQSGQAFGTDAGDVANVGHDTISSVLNVWGSNYDDILRGSDNASATYEAFEGRRGNDFIDGRGGYDVVVYSSDTTTTMGITVNLAAGTVTGDITVGTDTLRAVEAIRGTNSDDYYDATNFGTTGANIGSLGTFNDFQGGGGNDTVIGNGNTRVNYSNALASVTVNLQTNLNQAGVTATNVAGTATGTTEGTDTLTGVNAAQGSAFNDTLLGSNFNNTLIGLGGDDFIDGRGGFDIASYNSMTLATGGIVVDMTAGTVTDNVSNVVGHDTLRSIEGVQGTNFNDSYSSVNFGTGANVGNNGTFNQFEGMDGDDAITGNFNTRAIYSNAAAAVTVSVGAGGTGTGHSTAASDAANVGNDTFIGGVNSVGGSNFADTINMSAYAGAGGNNFNSVQGLGGNDTITGNGNTQVLFFGATAGVTITMAVGHSQGTAAGDAAGVGTDTFTGVYSAVGSGFADVYDATGFGVLGAANTGIFGSFNFFEGQGGDDNLIGNGNTQIRFDNATGSVVVDLAASVADGNASVGHDTFTGANAVYGSNFDDTILGSTGSDFLQGGNGGNDILDGRGGNDSLTGGAGADTFVYANGGGADTITDFNRAEGDKIDLTGVSGIFTLADVQAHASPQGSNTLIDFGGGNTITLSNVAVGSLVASDFVFAGNSAPTNISLSNNSVAENSAAGIVVGVLSDVDPDAGDTATYTLLNDAGGRFAINGSNLVVAGTLDYETAASHQVTVQVTDSVGHNFSKVLTVNVTDVAGVTLNGDTGANTLIGTPEVDTLSGLDGNDRLQGLGANDTLDGGNGFDRAVYTDATGGVTVNLVAGTASGAGVGSDTLISIEGVVGSEFADTFNTAGFNGSSGVPGAFLGLSEFEGRGGNDTITGAINTSGQVLTRLSYVNATGAVTVDIAAGIADGDASTGHDTFTNINAIIGSASGDTLSGSDNVNGTFEQFDGRGGNDLIDGRGGYDFAIYNGDVVSTGITVNLAAGTVTGDPSIGLDTLRSIEGVRGTNLADTYDATGFGAGSINAGSLGTFNNFDGQGGDDTIIGNGNTRLQFTNSLAAVTVDIAAGTAHSTATGDAAQVGTDTFSGVNAVLASMFDDTLSGGATNDTFTGLAGNDFIDGRDGFDVASYNNLTYTTGGILVDMTAGVVTGDSSVGVDTLRSIEGVQGTFFVDTYNASGFGGGANIGNNGTFNQFEGMAGNDLITGNGNTRVLYTNAAAAVTVDLAAGTGRGTAGGDLALVGTDTFFSGVNSVTGSAFDDNLSGASTNDTFVGLAGNDFIDGRGGFDTAIYNISTTAGVNIDMASGTVTGIDVGTDTLRNIEGVQGSNFADTYVATGYGQAGAANASTSHFDFNTFQGNGGNDTITGNGNTQIVFTNSTGAVNVNLTTGVVTGDGSVGADTIIGGVFNVLGSNANDTITGSASADTLNGNGGNDTISGLGGNDSLAGGLGADTFVYANGGGADTISDFNRVEGDKIDVRGVSGIFTLADIQARASQQGPNTLIDFGAGNTITLNGITVGSLVATDFVFNNVVTGTSSGETLVGTSQVDGIFGLAGNDRLQGLGGNDTLDGGDGFDRAVYTDATGGVVVNLVAGTAGGAGIGNDTLISIEGVVGSEFADTFNTDGFNGSSGVPGSFLGLSEFEGRGGNDNIIGAVNVSGQILTRLSYVNETAFVTVDIQAGTANGTSTGHDTFTNVNAIIGSAFSDTLYGSDNASNTFEQFDGRGGSDFIDGRGGYDFANYSSDVVATGIAVNLAAGTVTGDPSIGLDTLRSIEGVRGTNLSDTYDATGFGAGSINAGSLGTFNNFDGLGGDDTITGNGNTRLQYTNSLAAVTVDIANGLAYGTAAGDVAQVGTDHFTGVNAALGSMFDDTLLGGNGNDNFTGLAGNDFINGGNGFDTAIYNNLTYTTAGISVDMTAGIVTGNDSSVGVDTLRSIEGVQGTFFADTYSAVNFGSGANIGNNGTFNQFEGMAGNDTITGNGNTRVLYTNASAAVTVDLALATGHGTVGDAALVGTDTFVSGVNSAQGSAYDDSLSGAATNDSFVGLAGDDFLDGRDGFDTAIYNISTTAGIGVNLTTGVVTGLDASVGTDTLRNIEGVQGTNFNDTFTAVGYGLAGADNVSSTQGSSNTFQGNGGDDTVTGNGSTVVVFTNSTGNVAITIGAGGTGSSTGDTSVGTDSFTGGVNGAVGSNFDDAYNASAFSGFNTFQGNAGNDTITGNGNTEIQYSNSSGSVNVSLSTGSVTGNTSVGTDSITGGVSRVFGSNSADTITGTSASEALNGNGGADTINGGGGADTLTGGAGNDNFVFAASLTNGATITDFNGNSAGVGDSLEFHGFGTAAQGATLTWISGNQWQVHSGLDSHNEIITLTGNSSGALHTSDYQFLN